MSLPLSIKFGMSKVVLGADSEADDADWIAHDVDLSGEAVADDGAEAGDASVMTNGSDTSGDDTGGIDSGTDDAWARIAAAEELDEDDILFVYDDEDVPSYVIKEEGTGSGGSIHP